ncbi:MAG: hypothetical protein VX768_08540, partial [Planctomycetota bacterium]|nr:hypothetical protein [Planctomycetota bacterium]
SSVNFQLENGWNLVSIGQQLDSKFDKNVEAVGNAAGAIAEIPFPGASGTGSSGGKTIVKATTNIPLGYYESVLLDGPNGKKRLQGFRYVGFLPYGGVREPSECQTGGDLYGLCYRDGLMTFRKFAELQGEQGKIKLVRTRHQAPKQLPTP